MTEIGYALSSEEHRPDELVRQATMAEDHGFSFALISDHFHPWTDAQGHSSFVWAVLGAIARETSRLRVGTGVTCPTFRMHPAIVAHAAATVAAMMPGRFFLGLGSGENLNEHITGARWPEAEQRAAMLEEAVEIIRDLWKGENTSRRGASFTVENARVYTLPESPPPIYLAASGPAAARMAGRIGDGFIGTSPEDSVVGAFDEAGGRGKPRYGQVTVCYAPSEREGIETALKIWPNGAIPGQLSQELPLPQHFEQAASLVREEDIAKTVVCGPDPERHVEAIRAYAGAGYDHVYVHQVGPQQEAFMRFYAEHVLPKVAS